MRVNSDRFLDAFNSIEKYLRRLSGSDQKKTFYVLVDEGARKNAAVRNYAVDLKEFGDLRNAIVHESTDNHVLAEPNDASVQKIERIAQLISQPPALRNFINSKIYTLDTDESVGAAVHALFVNEFSQAPVFNKGEFFGLLTANTITRWLGANVSDEIFSLEETKLSKVLEYTEDLNHVLFIRVDLTVFEVLELFHKFTEKGKRLEAILITQSGKPTESILGMLTIWDLPRLQKAVEIK